jgi:hypothetical protein
MKTLALCMNIPELENGGWYEREICKKYPGSGWLPVLSEMLTGAMDLDVISGKRALAAIQEGILKSRDVFIIQEEENKTGQELTKIGCHPFLLLCFESPLFTPFFYESIPYYRKIFQYQMLFAQGTHHMYFPSFDLNDLREPLPLKNRLDMCMVVSNKHYSSYASIFSKSALWNDATQASLHDVRYNVISMYRQQSKFTFDLYGKGWPAGFAKEIPPGKKINTIRNYRANFCYENIKMEGYITEKLIEALVAGCIPAYIGAPDVLDYIPKGCFSSDRKTDWEAIQIGQQFLKSAEGRKFSYQGFAETVLDLIVK